MWKNIICRHGDVDWIDSHACRCQRCGKFGHWFEEGYVIWTRAAMRPPDETAEFVNDEAAVTADRWRNQVAS